MEQNYQLELKHLAPRVYAAVLHKEGLKSAGCVLFMDCTGLTTKERLNWRKESFFLEIPPLPGRKGHQWMEKNLSRARDSCQNHAEGTAVAYRCWHQIPTRVRRAMILYKSALHPKLYAFTAQDAKTWNPKHVKMFQSNLSLSRTCAACLSNTSSHLSPCLMIYKEQYLDRNIF